ncbi:MAG: choice-of-anchor V domain-containing protein, partial [Candidatus Thermoplasmatota archaeon]|nr:choice-of-anchor V domain-containing protein [Candidatus Thermoplasmatota archaeon]
MRGRATLLLGVLLVALMAAPQFTAAPGGIGAAGDQGCTCHGGESPDTTVIVDGLPETYNASETYTFTVTVQNDVMEINEVDWNGRAGGYRILVSHGDIVAVPASLSQMMDGGLTHTDEANTVRSWTFEWTAPAADDLNVDMKIYGNAVNGGNGAGGDHWNEVEFSIAGINAGALAPSASALIIFVTSIGLAAGLIFTGILWVFYRRSPETFTMEKFWGFLKPWLTTTDHKEVGIMYFLFGFFFFLVGGLLALLFRIQLALPENDFLTYDEYNSFFTLHGTTMIFLAAMPMIAGFMNYVLPLQIG